jgi:hypothetical protein
LEVIEMNEMKPPPETVFIARLEQAFTDIANEAFRPPHIIDTETMRQIREGLAAASKRLTRTQMAQAIFEAARTASHPEIVRAHFRSNWIDAPGMRDCQCGLQSEGGGGVR